MSANAMPASCSITRPAVAGAVFDEDTAQTTYLTAQTVYTGPCRVVAEVRGQESSDTVGDRKIVQGRYLVAIATTADVVQADDVVTVIASAGDPGLVGKTLQVVGARRGSSTFERLLSCQMQQPVSR